MDTDKRKKWKRLRDDEEWNLILRWSRIYSDLALAYFNSGKENRKAGTAAITSVLESLIRQCEIDKKTFLDMTDRDWEP